MWWCGDVVVARASITVRLVGPSKADYVNTAIMPIVKKTATLWYNTAHAPITNLDGKMRVLSSTVFPAT